MKESERIGQIQKIVSSSTSGKDVLTGIGDDAAVVESPSGRLLLCTDAMVESVHFDLRFSTPADVGHKALAVVLSDLAAMNGRPLHALFSIALPKSATPGFLEGFYEGASQLAKELDTQIVGGDLTSSPHSIFVDAVAVGTSARPILRSGAKPGDWLAVSGTPGASAAGLALLKSRAPVDRAPMAAQASPQSSPESSPLVMAHLRPRPRFDLLEPLAPMCTALIDISDGLSSEVHHLAKRSAVGFEIEASAIPLHTAALEVGATMKGIGQRDGRDQALAWALGGGEDYELLATLDPAKVQQNGGPPPGFTIIGRALDLASVAAGYGPVSLRHADGSRSALASTGFDHFA